MSNSNYIVAIASLLFIAVVHPVNGFSVPYSTNHPRQIVSTSTTTTTTTTTTLFAKRVSFKEDARRGLVSGINQVANAVRVTLGPKVNKINIIHIVVVVKHKSKELYGLTF